MRKKLLNNLGLKLASLVLAFILWFLVVQIDDPKERDRFTNVPVKLINTELLEKEGKVYEVLDDTDKVTVTVTAPRSIVSQLRSSDIIAQADVSRLTDINTIPITLEVQNAEVTAIEGDHDVVRLSVESRKRKWIKLIGNTVGEAADGYIVSNAYLDQTNIEVSGPESAVSLVDYASVDINVEGATTSLSANIDIKLYDADGNVVVNESLKTNVEYAHMTVEVLATKDVPVVVEYMGVPAEGYLDTGVVESDITTVKIAGTTSALANVNAITVPAERMNITGESSNMVDIVNLKEYLPENIRFADKKFDGKITATVYIEPLVELDIRIPAYNITLRNAPEGFVAKLPEDIENYELTVSGLQEFVDPLRNTAVAGMIDIAAWMEVQGLEELPAGTYEMPVIFGLSEDIEVVEAVMVQVIIQKQEET